MNKIIASLVLSILSPAIAFGYILPTRIILDKVSENAGSGIYAIEQEVTFQHADMPLTVKETWLIENDRSMRLTVSATMENGQTFHLQNIYLNGQKNFMLDKSKKTEHTSVEFLERYFNARNSDALANLLTQLKNYSLRSYAKKGPP